MIVQQSRLIIETIDLQIILATGLNIKGHILSQANVMNMYYAETIQQQTKHRRTADILAAILKVVIGGEGTKRGIEGGAQLSFSQMKRYLLLSLECRQLIREEHEEFSYRITEKGIRFLHTVEQMNEMIQYSMK